ncbi:MAG: hypothetical protein HY072_09495 [Deltaproteobacteria bacterium]|nr:hypothetical protein [Deltaproteobacteria bacterium]
MHIQIWILIVIILIAAYLYRQEREWWYEREIALLDEIEGPYWTHDDFHGDIPDDYEQIIESHKLAMLNIIGEKRLMSARKKRQ